MKADCDSCFIRREHVLPDDVEGVRALTQGTAVFSREEVDLSAELVQEYLERGEASGYRFVFYEAEGELAGYACHGRIPCTRSSHDLYWIAVSPEFQGKGLGTRLLEDVKRAVLREGGERIYAETSSTPRYGDTRRFYQSMGFFERARFEHFYGFNDAKVVYELRL